MAFLHHGTIRKYTAALLSLFNDFEIQYQSSTGATISKAVPITYASKEKAKIFDKVTTEQILSGNYNVLPRSSLSLVALTKLDNRITNKNLKINNYRTSSTIEYQFNSVPYEFTYELIFQCRGMNEATQIIEQIAPKFNPIVNIDVWDVSNLSEPTRIPVKLLDIGLENEDYEELSTNIFTITCGISVIGNLYPPIKSQERIQEFQMMINEFDGTYYKSLELLDWEVGLDGYIIEDTLVIDNDPNDTGTVEPPSHPPSLVLGANRIAIDDIGDYFTAINVEDALQELVTMISGSGSSMFAENISILDSGDLLDSTNVEAALQEIQTNINSLSSNLEAENISILDSGDLLDSTNVEDALQEIQTNVSNISNAIYRQSTEPVGVDEGILWYDSTTKQLKVYKEYPIGTGVFIWEALLYNNNDIVDGGTW